MRTGLSRLKRFLSSAFRPSRAEVEAYAQVISQSEGRSLRESRRQAELQLWTWNLSPSHLLAMGLKKAKSRRAA